MTIPPIARSGALTKIRMRPLAKFCTWVTSFVSLRHERGLLEAVAGSVKSRPWMRRYRSPRSAAPKRCETLLEMTFRIVAPTAPSAVTPSMSSRGR